MKAIVLAGLAGLAIAGPVKDKRQARPPKEQLCAAYNGDYDRCQNDIDSCVKDIRHNNKVPNWDSIAKCLPSRQPQPAADPTPEQICAPMYATITTIEQNASAILDRARLRLEPPFRIASLALFSAAWRRVVRGSNPAAAPGVTAQFKADIRADTNRDGKVDIEGSSDVEGKETWTEAAGAIFLSNIGDETGRCPKDSNKPVEELAQCHDAADDIQRAPKYLAPLRTVPIRGLDESASATVSVEDGLAGSLVRIFRAVGNDKWEFINNNTRFSKQDIEQGLILGIDARDVRRPDGWDGKVKVDFTVRAAGASSTDSVMLRVAPVLIHHHLQLIQTAFASEMSFTARSQSALAKGIVAVYSGIEQAMSKIGMSLTRLRTDDAWAQDFFEPGYQTMPGPEGPISMRIMVEGRQRNPRALQLIYTQLRGPGVGGLRAYGPQRSGDPTDTLKAGGNVESIPPYEFNGKKFPAGRVILGGDDKDNHPLTHDFYSAQESQNPLLLDTTWLGRMHIDEIIQFVPSNSPRGWKALVVDPQLGLKLLQTAEKHGFGGIPFFNLDTSSRIPEQVQTITQFLNDEDTKNAAQLISQRMQANIELLKSETGITDEEIIRLPMLYGSSEKVDYAISPSGGKRKKARSLAPRDTPTTQELDTLFKELVQGPDANSTAPVPAEDKAEKKELEAEAAELIEPVGGKQETSLNQVKRRQSAITPGKFESYLPALVNGIPLSPSHYVAPKPWGPKINGKDLFEIVATSRYKSAGFSTVDYVDDWVFSHEKGELHCLTNTWREMSPWW